MVQSAEEIVVDDVQKKGKDSNNDVQQDPLPAAQVAEGEDGSTRVDDNSVGNEVGNVAEDEKATAADEVDVEQIRATCLTQA
eukprot:2352676-Pleurochrysis_carterae.AAC.1